MHTDLPFIVISWIKSNFSSESFHILLLGYGLSWASWTGFPIIGLEITAQWTSSLDSRASPFSSFEHFQKWKWEN